MEKSAPAKGIDASFPSINRDFHSRRSYLFIYSFIYTSIIRFEVSTWDLHLLIIG